MKKSINICNETNNLGLLKIDIIDDVTNISVNSYLVINNNNQKHNLKLLNSEIIGMYIFLTFEENTLLNFKRENNKIYYELNVNKLEKNINNLEKKSALKSFQKFGTINQNSFNKYIIKDYTSYSLIYELLVLFLMDINYNNELNFTEEEYNIEKNIIIDNNNN
jgi:hypothetical protein